MLAFYKLKLAKQFLNTKRNDKPPEVRNIMRCFSENAEDDKKDTEDESVKLENVRNSVQMRTHIEPRTHRGR